MALHSDINELLTLANGYLDRQQWDAYAELFAPGAVLVTPSGKVVRGRAELRRLLKAHGPRDRRHLNVQVDAAVEGERANATSYQLILEAGREPAVLGGIYCVDLLKRLGGRWRFAARRMFDGQTSAPLFA